MDMLADDSEITARQRAFLGTRFSEITSRPFFELVQNVYAEYALSRRLRRVLLARNETVQRLLLESA
jgi:hypothetical protein